MKISEGSENSENTDGTKENENEENVVKVTSFSIPIVPALLGIILVLGIAVGVLMNKTCPNVEGCEVTTTCPKCPTPITQTEKGSLNLLYLIPPNCSTCDFRMIQKISTDLNIKIIPYVTDAVQTPMMFIGIGNKATLALANSRYNVLTAICEFANDENACILKNKAFEKEGSVGACLSKYNISARAIIFYHSNSCIHCKRMMPLVRKLEKEGYNFTWIETKDEEKMKIVKDCLVNVLDTRGYVPQFACPLTKKLRVGVFGSIDEMRKFADECINAEV